MAARLAAASDTSGYGPRPKSVRCLLIVTR